jgi:hypothetical protein
MRDRQDKGIDLREELIKFHKWFNDEEMPEIITVVDEYLSKIKPQ